MCWPLVDPKMTLGAYLLEFSKEPDKPDSWILCGKYGKDDPLRLLVPVMSERYIPPGKLIMGEPFPIFELPKEDLIMIDRYNASTEPKIE